MYALTRIFMYPVSMCSGSLLESNVRIKCLVGISLSSLRILILLTSITFCSFHPSSSSASLSVIKSSSVTTPRTVFIDLCAVTVIGMSPNLSRLGSFSYWALQEISRSRSPLDILVILYPGPSFCSRYLATRKGETPLAGMSVCSLCIT